MAAEGNGSTWAVVIAFGAMVVSGLVAVVNGIWTLGQSRRETDDKIAEKDKSLTEDLTGLERRFKTDIDQSIRFVGESLTAIRQKITEIELWNRDHFIDRNTFQLEIANLRRSIERLEEKLEKRLDRIDAKLDKGTSAE